MNIELVAKNIQDALWCVEAARRQTPMDEDTYVVEKLSEAIGHLKTISSYVELFKVSEAAK